MMLWTSSATLFTFLCRIEARKINLIPNFSCVNWLFPFSCHPTMELPFKFPANINQQKWINIWASDVMLGNGREQIIKAILWKVTKSLTPILTSSIKEITSFLHPITTCEWKLVFPCKNVYGNLSALKYFSSVAWRMFWGLFFMLFNKLWNKCVTRVFRISSLLFSVPFDPHFDKGKSPNNPTANENIKNSLLGCAKDTKFVLRMVTKSAKVS